MHLKIYEKSASIMYQKRRDVSFFGKCNQIKNTISKHDAVTHWPNKHKHTHIHNIQRRFRKQKTCFTPILRSKFLGLWRINVSFHFHTFSFIYFKRMPSNLEHEIFVIMYAEYLRFEWKQIECPKFNGIRHFFFYANWTVYLT